MTNNEYATFIDQLLEKQIAFATWALPGENTQSLLIGKPENITFFDQFNHLNGEKGFVFAPFRITKTNPVILLKPGFYISDCSTSSCPDIEQLQSFESTTNTTEVYHFLEKEAYLNTIEQAVSEIRNGALSKVIISRRIPVLRKEKSLGEIFLRLSQQTPNAFRYLVNLPVAGTWMGATPEILLSAEGNTCETVSLAGTQARHNGPDYAWFTKDIEEQAFVSRYMLDVFFRFNIHQYKTKGPETLESGKVAHLKTSFFFPLENIKNRLGDFIADLHPTPAVCGLPKDLADQYILNNEKHDRKYYTGYLGPWRLEKKLRLFVNLRCMEVFQKQFILYAGGGITAKSDPEKEWEETNQKAGTLLSVVNGDSK